jgi:hypothetical protein
MVFPAAIDAWHAARDGARPDDLICIAGSVFLAGELRPALVKDCSLLSPASDGRLANL